MNKTYFPGANSGKGFFSRFDGIVPLWEEKHYTYVLKGGPGVGKNTLMKQAARRAEEKGYTVEEFRCASDPKSLDAIRIPELHTVLLDGTAPHSIDPVTPGIADEIIDLGHFKNHREFATFRPLVEDLFASNKRHYRAAYAMLGAAYSLKKEALSALSDANADKLHKYIVGLIGNVKDGNKRGLFARSATPEGVIDYTETFLPKGAITFSSTAGEAVICELLKLLGGKQAEVYYDFIVPEQPRAIVFADSAFAMGDGGDTSDGFLDIEIPKHIGFAIEEVERLVKRSTEEIAASLHTHDRIEEIYRDFVDYDRVNEEGEKLLKRIGL